jgi:hypothetical protein
LRHLAKQLNRLLRERRKRLRRSSFNEDREHPAQHPIIDAFDDSDMRRFAELADLFIAGYLLAHLPEDAELSVEARSLASALNNPRRRSRPPRQAPATASLEADTMGADDGV